MNYVQDLILINQNKKKYRKNDDFYFQRIKARILTMTKDPANLLPRYLKKASASDSSMENIMAQFALSQIYLQKGDFAKAIGYLEALIKKFPDKPILKTDLGIVYYNQGEIKKAIELFQNALEADNDNPYTKFHLAGALEQSGEHARAIRLYKELLDTQPTYSKGHYNLGKALAAHGDKGESHYHLGAYHWYEGDSKTAIFHLNQAISELDNNSAVKRQAIKLLEKIRKIEKESGPS